MNARGTHQDHLSARAGINTMLLSIANQVPQILL